MNYNDQYDDLDMPCSSNTSQTNRIFDPKTLEEYLAVIQISSTIKDNIIKQSKHDATLHLLRMLKAVINEQEKMGLLDQDCGSYIYEAVRHEAIYQGIIDRYET